MLLQGLLAMIVGLLIAAGYTHFTGENVIRRWGFGIFGVPVMITFLKLLGWLGDPDRKKSKDDHEGKNA